MVQRPGDDEGIPSRRDGVAADCHRLDGLPLVDWHGRIEPERLFEHVAREGERIEVGHTGRAPVEGAGFALERIAHLGVACE